MVPKPTSTTPGSERSSTSACSKNRVRIGVVLVARRVGQLHAGAPDSGRLKAGALRDAARRSVFVSRPAPAKKATPAASCTTTSALRQRRIATPPVFARPDSCKPRAKILAQQHADGTRADSQRREQRRADRHDEHDGVSQLEPVVCALETEHTHELEAAVREHEHTARRPRARAAHFRARASRASRRAPAPSAARTASSLRRAVSCASCKFATLAQAISSTASTRPWSTIRRCRGRRSCSRAAARHGSCSPPVPRAGCPVTARRCGGRARRARR